MAEKTNKLRVLVVGCGNMGASHATAYHILEGFEICGLVSRGASKEALNKKLGGNYALFDDYEKALDSTQPDAVCISTYPDTHEHYAIRAFEKGCHVFVEKPIESDLPSPPAFFATIDTDPFGPTTSFTKKAVSLIMGPQPASYHPTEPSSKRICNCP